VRTGIYTALQYANDALLQIAKAADQVSNSAVQCHFGDQGELSDATYKRRLEDPKNWWQGRLAIESPDCTIWLNLTCLSPPHNQSHKMVGARGKHAVGPEAAIESRYDNCQHRFDRRTDLALAASQVS